MREFLKLVYGVPQAEIVEIGADVITTSDPEDGAPGEFPDGEGGWPEIPEEVQGM